MERVARNGIGGFRTRVAVGVAMLALAAGGPLLSAQPGKPAAGGYICFSRPSEVRELSFSQRGVIAETTVKVGDVVKAGQELSRMEDSVQRAQVQLAEQAVSDSSPRDQAKAALEFREEELRLVTEAKQRSAAGNPAELREAKFRRDTAAIELAAANSKAKSDVTMLEREKARLNEMRIVSPINGTVVVVSKRGGEGVTEGVPVVTLVSVDPLWADVNVPPRVAAQLKVGGPALAEWEDVDVGGPMSGKILSIAPAADPARLIQVRVEIPNPKSVPAGLHGAVRFPGIEGAAGTK